MFVFRSIFDNFGTKLVSATDVDKGAYVPTKEQVAAIEAAGYVAAGGGGGGANVTIVVLFDPLWSELRCSFYGSQRAGSGRRPEPRLGQEITRWMAKGDTIVIGNIGSTVYATKLLGGISAADTGREFARRMPSAHVKAMAAKAGGKPPQRTRQVADFVRNPYVVAAALQRANGVCEMPDCARETFERPDGTIFLEVHHIQPLAEGGDDSLRNAAALCPTCHRELHHGAARIARRLRLDAYVATLP